MRPDQGITRAEFIALANRMWGLMTSKPADFSDLPKTGWAYTEFSIALSAGYIKGYEGKVRPDELVTRQEAAVMISRLLLLEDGSTERLAAFSDYSQIAVWSRPKVASLVNIEAMKGCPDGSFAPKRPMTRAESMELMETFNFTTGGAGDLIVDRPGVVGDYYPSSRADMISATISSYGVTLMNMNILGDVLLDEGIGGGEITLKNLTVKGNVIIKGSGAVTVRLIDSSLEQIEVQQKNGEVRLLAEGTTAVNSVLVHSGVKLEENGGTGGGFTSIKLGDVFQAGAAVTLNGSFEQVNAESGGYVLQLQKGLVSKLNVASGAAGLQVILGAGTVVDHIVLNAAASIAGLGVVQAATLNEGAQGSYFARRPASADGSRKDSI